MPIFEKNSDDLDCYLHRFEQSCTAFRINRDLWVMTLIKSLKGHALEVYKRMDADDTQDYEISVNQGRL